jgi:GNAT superfamily N-acetyltransferase
LSHESTPRAARCLAAALENDPFYHAITVDFAASPSERRTVLASYFEYSIVEGQQSGYSTIPDEAFGAAVWTKPQPAEKSDPAQAAKLAFVSGLLGETGLRNYHSIIAGMTAHAEAFIPQNAWYLSILGVCPDVQGKGMGAALLNPVLSLADAGAVPCYVEAFNPRTLNFYRRIGFSNEQSHHDPVTGQDYWILLRQPNQL